MTMDVQMAFIGGLVLCKKDVASEVIVDVEAADFETDELQAAFNAVKGYWETRGDIDLVELNATHEKQAEMLIACVEACKDECVVLSRERMGQWAKLIKEKAALRRFQSLALESASALTTYEDLSEIYQQMGEAMSLKAEEEDAWTYEDVLNDYVLHMDEKPVYIKTGLERLDEALHISPGDFIIIGGRPSAGKTALSLQLACEIAKNGRKVAYFSLETDPDTLYARIIANQLGVPLHTVKNKTVSINELDRLAAIKKYPLFVRSAAGKSVGWIRTQSIRMQAKVVFIDYLQLIHQAGAKDRYSAVTEISMALHEFAQSTGTLVVALAQLNRETARAGIPPTAADLRESGQIEQDADAIILLAQNVTTKKRPEQHYHFALEKNKEGNVGSLDITFQMETQQFKECVWM